MFDAFLESVATAIGSTSAQAGIILSLMWTAILDLVLGIATKSGMGVVVASVLSLVFFVAIGWFPVWTGAVLALVFALLFARDTISTIIK